MDNIFYLGKVGIIYSALYLIYFGLFRNSTFFKVNRAYLLLIVPFSFLLPLISRQVAINPIYKVTLSAFSVNANYIENSSLDRMNFLSNLYVLIAGFMLLRLVLSVFRTLNVIHKIKEGRVEAILPFSFFKFIYVPKSIDVEDRNAIIHHEQIHATHFHSIDVFIYELTKIALWWNPFVWMGLQSVKNNHEFIADKLASDKADKYSSVLVAQLLGVNCSVLTNNFKSKPLIKKRIMMMKTKRTNRLNILKYVLIVPIVAATLITTTNNNVIANPVSKAVIIQGDDKVYDKVDVMPEFKGGTDALMNYLGNHVKYPEEAKNQKIEGTVYISFIIDEKGKINTVEILKSANPLLDEESKRVILGMPKWEPGKKDGKKVNVKFVLPINFKLQK